MMPARAVCEEVERVLAPLDRATDYLAFIASCPYPENGTPLEYDHAGLLSVKEILADPDLCRPREAVLPRVGWRGRSSMLHAREKVGKSVFLRAGAAAVSTGRRFLGEETEPGVVLWVALEEHIADAARGLAEFDCDQEAVVVLDRVDNPLADLTSAIERTRPVLVVIDTLAAFVATLGLESGSSKDWAPVVLGLTRLAHDTDTALVILHHSNKGGRDYRDSTAIGASVDLILGMTEGDELNTRKISSKGRWRTEDFAVRLIGNRYELAAGELSLDMRIRLFVERNPGASTTAIRSGVQGQAKMIDHAIRRLEARQAIVNQGSESHHKYEIPGQGSGQGGLSLG